jgi:hypothetical protein
MEGIIFGMICFGLAGFVVFRVIESRKRIKGIANWVSVVGEVVDNKQERQPKDDPESNLNQMMTYRYQVNGHEYTSHLEFDYDNFLGLNRWVAKYQPGDAIDVLYDPANPQESTLTHFDQDILYAPLGIAFILTLSGIIATIVSLALL